MNDESQSGEDDVKQESTTEDVSPESPQEPPVEQPMSEQELRRKLEEHFREQDVADVLVQFLISLSTLAYVKMGLTEDMEQYADLDQARLAVDSFKALLDAASDRLPDQEAKALAGALASMQITFAKASGG